MKKNLCFLFVLIFSLFIGILSVNAQDYYYINDNGVTFTKDQYDFISEMYYDGYQAYMTEDDMKYFDGVKMIPGTVEVKKYMEYDNEYQTRGNIHETQSKILQIAKASNVIAISCAWKKSPNVRSYDLIGAYLNGPSIIGTPSAVISYSGGVVYPSATKQPSNGFGAAIKLPTGGNSIIASSTFNISGSGRVYGSYQHAKSSISLANANSYSISSSGLGQVFYFSNINIRNKYDAMSGVFIDV